MLPETCDVSICHATLMDLTPQALWLLSATGADVATRGGDRSCAHRLEVVPASSQDGWSRNWLFNLNNDTFLCLRLFF